MFVKYTVDYYRSGISDYPIIIIDTDFEHNTTAKMNDGLDVITPIIQCYEEKGLRVAPNLVLLIKHLMERFHLSSDYVHNLEKVNPTFAKYRKDIDHYMILL